jgi:hypothetical protein
MFLFYNCTYIQLQPAGVLCNFVRYQITLKKQKINLDVASYPC